MTFSVVQGLPLGTEKRVWFKAPLMGLLKNYRLSFQGVNAWATKKRSQPKKGPNHAKSELSQHCSGSGGRSRPADVVNAIASCGSQHYFPIEGIVGSPCNSEGLGPQQIIRS